jgi:hypothetical protein
VLGSANRLHGVGLAGVFLERKLLWHGLESSWNESFASEALVLVKALALVGAHGTGVRLGFLRLGGLALLREFNGVKVDIWCGLNEVGGGFLLLKGLFQVQGARLRLPLVRIFQMQGGRRHLGLRKRRLVVAIVGDHHIALGVKVEGLGSCLFLESF